uniref:Inositol polyphosphate-related phosphatase domain-containing protein n=1 Tax=Rhodosorus marinus TaxID=101924 RepID=A0A7S0BS84_9RHOD|mmetsp:Transcript_6629/g.9580  ORF Transcript_6629/g.9580 Transcript_6629/m.9580 type:complete len:589 (+) Transcript_6629:384-2150(+)
MLASEEIGPGVSSNSVVASELLLEEDLNGISEWAPLSSSSSRMRYGISGSLSDSLRDSGVSTELLEQMPHEGLPNGIPGTERADRQRKQPSLGDSVVMSPLSMEGLPDSGEPLASPRGRRDWVSRQVEERESEFTQYQDLTVFAGTWNVCAAEPTMDLKDWLFVNGRKSDVYVVGLQEVQPLKSVSALITNPSCGKRWSEHIASALAREGDYVRVCEKQMVGIVLLVFVRAPLEHDVRDLVVMEAGTGFMSAGGNKGAVCVRFQIRETSFCCVACHLAAQQDSVARRKKDYREILRKIFFVKDDGEEDLPRGVANPKSIREHDIVLWLGDLNYRIDMDSASVLKAINQNEFGKLFAQDQFVTERAGDHTLFEGFREAPIVFAPTYKTRKAGEGYEVGKDGIPKRPPSWTDRILWRTAPHLLGSNTSAEQKNLVMQCLDYEKSLIWGSDHRPVFAQFLVKVKEVDEAERARVYREVYESLVPEVKLDSDWLRLPRYRRGRAAEMNLVVKNAGMVPLRLEVQNLPASVASFPMAATLHSGEQVILRITVDSSFGDERKASWDGAAAFRETFEIAVEDGQTRKVTVASSRR